MTTVRPSRPASLSGSPANAFRPSASITSGIVARSTSAWTNCRVLSACPSPGPMATTSRASSRMRSTASGSSPSSISSMASVMYSAPIIDDDRLCAARRRDGHEAGARAQGAHGGQMCGAGLAARAGNHEHAAVVALVAVGRSRRNQLAHRGAREQVDARAVEPLEDVAGDADVGDDDVAGARFRGRQDERELRRGERDGQAGLDRVADRVARVGRQPRGQIDGDDRNARRVHVGDHGFDEPDIGALRPVPKIASTISVQSVTSDTCSSHAWLSATSTTVMPSRPRISRFVRASPRTSDTRPIRKTDTSTPRCDQRARDDEAVAAVVAAAAQHGHLAVERGRRTSPPWRRPPGGRRSPSARATEMPMSSIVRRSASRICAALSTASEESYPKVRLKPDTTSLQRRMHAVRFRAWLPLSTSTDACPIRSTPSCPSSITGFSTARASTRRCGPTTASRFCCDRHMRRLRTSARHARARGAADRRRRSNAASATR